MSAPAGIKFGRFDGEDVYTTNDSDRLVRLPMWYGMRDEEVEKVIEGVKGVWRDIRRDRKLVLKI